MNSIRTESRPIAELEAANPSQDGQVTMAMKDLPSLQPSQKQTVDTRVLLNASVVQDAIHNVSHWVSWLTTAALWDIKKVDVQVQSVLQSNSTLVAVSVPTYAWDRLPERPAYRFIGFIRSANMFQVAKNSATWITETLASRFEAEPILDPTNIDLKSDPQARLFAQPYHHPRIDWFARSAAQVQEHSPLFPASGASTSPSRFASGWGKIAKPREPRTLTDKRKAHAKAAGNFAGGACEYCRLKKTKVRDPLVTNLVAARL